jgi:hypothetical protein
VTSDSVNLGSNPSPPATENADVSGVSGAKSVSEQPEAKERTAHTGRTKVGTARPHSRVYFISDGDAIKIGHSIGTKGRLAGLQTANPKRLRLMGEIPGTCHDERALHKRFAHLRLTGEWFQATRQLVSYIEDVTLGERERYVRARRKREKATIAKNSPEAKLARKLRQASQAYPDNRAIRSRTGIVCSLLECAGSGDRRPEVMKELKLQLKELTEMQAALGS